MECEASLDYPFSSLLQAHDIVLSGFAYFLYVHIPYQLIACVCEYRKVVGYVFHPNREVAVVKCLQVDNAPRAFGKQRAHYEGAVELHQHKAEYTTKTNQQSSGKKAKDLVGWALLQIGFQHGKPNEGKPIFHVRKHPLQPHVKQQKYGASSDQSQDTPPHLVAQGLEEYVLDVAATWMPKEKVDAEEEKSL